MAGYTLNFRVLLQYSELFLQGVVLTIKICVGSMIISFFLGMLLAVPVAALAKIWFDRGVEKLSERRDRIESVENAGSIESKE